MYEWAWVCGLFWAERTTCSHPGDRSEHVYFGNFRPFMGKYTSIGCTWQVGFLSILCCVTSFTQWHGCNAPSWDARKNIFFMKCHTYDLGNGVARLWLSRPSQRVCCHWPWGGALSTFMSVGGATCLSFTQVMGRWRDSSASSPPTKLPNTLQLFMDWDSDFQACGMIEFQTKEVPRGANTLKILQVERLRHK